MNNLNDKEKEFILNPEFRKWVLEPNSHSNMKWENYLLEHPHLNKEVEKAREIILELFSEQYPLQAYEFKEMWSVINEETAILDSDPECEITLPINSSTNSNELLRSPSSSQISFYFLLKIAAVLLVSLGIGFVLFKSLLIETRENPIQPISYKTYQTPPGVKSTITLRDGTKVLLNSGSLLKYAENSPENQRLIYLEGEAFFDVFPNSQKPFTVKTGDVSTTAIGTSFNITAYANEDLMISLITGKVAIGIPKLRQDSIFLNEMEKINVSIKTGDIEKVELIEEEVLGWTKKTIVFNNTALPEAIRTLENWYGVTIQFENQPAPDLYISGKFKNETLKNVMEGLKHTVQLDYTIAGEIVKIKFSN